VIVGSHAHVLLGGGYLDDAYVHYGLGNFVFYATRSSGIQSGVLTLTMRGRATTAARWTPATISRGIPAPLSGSAAAAATRSWEALRGCTALAKSPTRAR
jgi:poly-gamma-glutamate synthesis protein (capsule biosynthesis protein)